jgi:transcriptional regulator with XRE-family HTH domain
MRRHGSRKLLHVRSNDGPRSGTTWASYVKAARQAAGLSQTDLAVRTGISRNTISRWEVGRYRPDKPQDVITVARATGVDPGEALAAAGFRPDVPPPVEPTRTPDPELDRIRQSKLSPAAKARLIARIKERREIEEEQRRREQEQRLADLEDLIRAQERLER